MRVIVHRLNHSVETSGDTYTSLATGWLVKEQGYQSS